MATFSDPFANLPGMTAQKQDGNLNVFSPKSGPVTLVIGTAGSGPADQLVAVDRVSEAVALFGKSGTLSRGIVEANQGGAENIGAYRIGATSAQLLHLGDHALAAGVTVETVDKDGSIAKDFSVLYEEADAIYENAGVYTHTGSKKRLRVYDSAGVLIYDNDPVGGALVDSGDVLVSGEFKVGLQGPSVGKDVQARATEQHNGFAHSQDTDNFKSEGARFDLMEFNATTKPLKLLIDKTLKKFEEVKITAVVDATNLTVGTVFPAASQCEVSGNVAGNAIADSVPDAGNSKVRCKAGGAGDANRVVHVFGLDANSKPAADRLVHGGAGAGAAGSVTFSKVTAVVSDGNAADAGGITVEVEAGGDDLATIAQGANSDGLVLSAAVAFGLYGGVAAHPDNAAETGKQIVVRGPSITPLHELAAAGELVITSDNANDDTKLLTLFGFDANGDPLKVDKAINGNGNADSGGAFKIITGAALEEGLAGTLTFKEKATSLAIPAMNMAAQARELNFVADVITLGAANIQSAVAGTQNAKFSGVHHVEVGDMTGNNAKLVRLRMYRVVEEKAGEKMDLARFANDGHASTSFLATDTTTGRGLPVSTVLKPGDDGLAPDKEKLFELLQDAYRNLETAQVDIVVPMDVYLDDKNVGDNATLATEFKSGTAGQFKAVAGADKDAFGRLMVFDVSGDAGVDLTTLGILGKNQATLVVKEASFQEGGKDIRRSAKVVALGDLKGNDKATKLLLDRPLVTAAQNSLDWALVGDADGVNQQPRVSNHLRYFRQFKESGEWKYEWWHEAAKQDLDGDAYSEVNFAYQLANFCYQLSTNDNNTIGAMGVNLWDSKRKKDLDLWMGAAPTLDSAGSVSKNGSGLLGNKFLAGAIGWSKGMFAVTGKDLANYPDSADIIVDTNGNNVDIGRYLSLVAAWPNFINTFDTTGFGYLASGAAAYAGLVSALDPHSAPTNKSLGTGVRMPVRLKKADRNSLAGSRLVWFHVKSGGRVAVDDAPTASLATSDYARLSTIRIVNAAVDEVRDVAEPFIGEAHTAAVRAAMKTAIDARLAKMQKVGMLRRFESAVSATPTQQILGQAVIELVLVPAFELRKISVLISLAAD